MRDTDFEQFCERRNLLTDAGYFDRWRALNTTNDSRAAWEAVEAELHEAFAVNRFLTYPAFHQAMLRSTDAAQKGQMRVCVRVYCEVNTV
jgi:hypothetical protein